MAADSVVEKRANLLASRLRWGKVDRQADEPINTGITGDYKQESIQQWLISINRVNEKTEPLKKKSAAEPLRRNASAEDDLVLGVEASIYGNPGPKTVKEFLRLSLTRSALPRWNSLTSAFSTQSSPLSVMDVLNLWSDDPEEVLIDLGFGVEEPDITGRIPARFINHQSQARGINLQVFLDAQKNRMDIENPDVRNRFRQLEVLHQVTTAFNSLVGGGAGGSSSSQGPLGNMSPETREKRKRMGMLLRRASKKTLSQARASQEHAPHSPVTASAAEPEKPAPPTPVHPCEKRGALKRSRSNLVENGSLTPLVEEQGSLLEPSEAQARVLPVAPQESLVRLRGHRESRPLVPTPPVRKRSSGEPMESFELEEIQSFDEGSVAGSVIGMADCIGESDRGFLSQVESCVIRTNSCQSDSSGFMEEPFIPAASQASTPGPELMKALNAMSVSTESQETLRRDSQTSPTSPTSPSSIFTSPTSPTSIFTSPTSILTSPILPTSPTSIFTSPTSILTSPTSPILPTSPTSPTSIFTSPLSGSDPAVPTADLVESTAGPLGKGRSKTPLALSVCSSVDVLAAEDTCEVGEEASAMQDSQGCQSLEGGICADTDCSSTAKDDLVPDDVTVTTATSDQGGGEQNLSEIDNVEKQHVRESAISEQKVVESPVSGEGGSVTVCGTLTSEASICDEAVSAKVSIDTIKEDLVGGECVVSEHAVTEHVICEDVVSERTASENTANECVAVTVSGGVSGHVVSKCENVSDNVICANPTVDCALNINVHKDYPSAELYTEEQSNAEDSVEQFAKSQHAMNEYVTIISSQSTIAVEKLTIPGEHQAPDEKGLSSEDTDSQLEAQLKPAHTSKQGTQISTTETSQSADSDEFNTVVGSNSVPVEPFRTERELGPPGRSVSVQMRSSLAPISHTAVWKGVAQESLCSRDVTQRRSSFSRRAWSEVEVSHYTPPPTSQSIAMEIPELASSIPCWQSRESLQGFGKFQMRSVSLDTGLSWEDGDMRLDSVMAGRGASLGPCECQCRCCSRHSAHMLQSEPSTSFPYSLDELEEMMQGVKRFRSILTEIEERLNHEQASVYKDLSVADREEVRDVLELRAAVKQEARELELQLADLVHHFDDSFKTKVNKLLDEQSHLCSLLRIHPSGTPRPESTSTRSVAIQCNLLPVTDRIDTWAPPHHSSDSTKQGKLDFVGFIQNLKNSVHQSISNDSLE